MFHHTSMPDTWKPMHMLQCDITYPLPCSHISQKGVADLCLYQLQCTCKCMCITVSKIFILCSYRYIDNKARYIDNIAAHMQ